MKVPWHWLLGLTLFILTASILSAAQTSLWFLIFGRLAAPMFWLILLVHASVSRPLWEATLFTYVLAFTVAPYTAFPATSMLIFCLGMMMGLMLIRERVYWGGPTYFMMMTGAAALGTPLLFWLTSRWLDKNPISFPNFFDWLLSALLTTLFSLPMYRLLQWFDMLGEQDAGAEGRIGPR